MSSAYDTGNLTKSYIKAKNEKLNTTKTIPNCMKCSSQTRYYF